MKGRSHFFVYALVAFNIFPHVFDQPLWVVMASYTFLGWKLASDLTRVPQPGRWGTLFLAAAFTLLIVNQFGSFVGDEASTATLLIMASLKTFEMRGYRDVMVLTYLCYFLLMTKLISSQSIGMSVFMAVDVVLITGFMMMYHSPKDHGNWRKLLRRATTLAAWGLPLMAALFFVFPRFTANLWGKPKEAAARSGFSGQLQPGEISRLMLSDEPAFRVYFENGVGVPRRQLYWRGTVLTSSQGLTWTSGRFEAPEMKSSKFSLDEIVRYEIFLEPHGQKWLFTMDWPSALEMPNDPRGYSYRERGGRVFEARRELSSREYYTAYSQPISRVLEWQIPSGDYWVEVQEEDSPSTLRWARELRQKHKSEEAIVNEVLKVFERDFRYSLSPPKMKSLDEFLYENKIGFCEHYAAALGSILRWAGIPSRVVLGYQGGTYSFLSDYLLVRQLDAHAWVEYWNSERKFWVRVDPTSVVAPERLQLGAQDFNDQLLRNTGDSGDTALALNRWLSDDLRTRLFRIRMLFDQAEAAWMGFLIRYDFSYQQELFSRLGWGRIKRWQLLSLSALSLLVLAGFLSWRFSRQGRRMTPAQKLYSRLCQTLAQNGLPRRANEGPLSYKQRALQRFPSAQTELEEVFEGLIQMRYGTSEPQPASSFIWRQKLVDLSKSLR